MQARRRVSRPQPWHEHRRAFATPALVPVHLVDWGLRWLAWALSRWALLDVLEHLGTFSVLIAVIFYFSESGNRRKQRHYQAWQVINTAQGKGGSGGRVEALEELNADHVSLVGVDASGAFLQGIALPRGNLSRCDLNASDLRNSRLHDATMSFCNLRDANFRFADLSGARLHHAQLQGADLHGAALGAALLGDADLSGVDLREADLSGLAYDQVVAMHLANVWGVRNAPAGFLDFAMRHGAVSIQSDEQWSRLFDTNSR
jgi:Pentapeptide repeats (8 copies)